jgi:flagellar basal body P-ring formation protein FlgA
MLYLALAAALPQPATPPAMVDAPVLVRAVQRGETLSAADFAVEKRPAATARGAIDGAAADGMEARRALQLGAVVRTADLGQPQAVHRGEQVSVVLRVGGLSITTAGRSLGDAAVGQPVRVVSAATNRTLDGVVQSAGVIRLQ